MFKNFLRSNFRALWKNRTHTAINLAGLCLGITCSLLIFLIVKFEFSFDDYHKNKERIYRVVTEYTRDQPAGYGAGMTYPLPPALKNEFPDLDEVVMVDANMAPPVVTVERENGTKEKFREDDAVFVDPSYFNVFDVEFVI